MIIPKRKYWKGNDWLKFIVNNLLVIFGSILLAFATATFLTNLNIVAGGLSGVAIIIQSFFPDVAIIDIIVAIGNIILWIIGFIFIGKDFAFKTLVSTITYPIFLSLFLRVPYFVEISSMTAGDGGVGNILFCALFSGVFVGAGVAITFLGGGSTGGVDTFIFIITKHTKIKESICSFLIDATIVVLSMFLIKDNFINSMCGVLSAFVTALMIEYIYIGNQTSYQADIISDKWEDISKYAQDKLLRGTTIIKAEGGYQGAQRVILRIVFEKKQYDKLRRYIAYIDPHAFVTYTQTNAVYGEGFKDHK